jgi:hypothetical protein
MMANAVQSWAGKFIRLACVESSGGWGVTAPAAAAGAPRTGRPKSPPLQKAIQIQWVILPAFFYQLSGSVFKSVRHCVTASQIAFKVGAAAARGLAHSKLNRSRLIHLQLTQNLLLVQEGETF